MAGQVACLAGWRAVQPAGTGRLAGWIHAWLDGWMAGGASSISWWRVRPSRAGAMPEYRVARAFAAHAAWMST